MTTLTPRGSNHSGARPLAAGEDYRDRLATLLIALTWAWSVLPRILQTLTAPKFRASVGEAAAPNSRIAALALLGLTLLLLAACVLVILVLLRDQHPGHLAGYLWLVSPWVYLVVRDLFTGARPGLTQLVYPLVVTALWMLRPRVRVLGVVGLLTGAAAAVSLALGVLLPAKGVFRDASGQLELADKALLPWGVLSGFLSHGNTLGVLMALGLPFVALVSRSWLRRCLWVLVLVALLWASSRTALAAVLLGTIALVILRAIPARRRFPWAVLAGTVPFLAVAALPLLTQDPTAFSSRGFVWAYSRLWWESSPWFGLGTDWFNEVGRTSERIASSAFHGHNQFMQFAVTGGVALLVLVIGLLISVAIRTAGLAVNGHLVGTVYLAVLAGTCLLEKPFAMVDNFSMSPVVMLPLAVLMFSVSGDRVEEPAADH